MGNDGVQRNGPAAGRQAAPGRQRHTGRTGFGRVVAASVLLAMPALVAGRCTPKPRVVEPANLSQIGVVGTPVEIDFGESPGPAAQLEVLLFRGVDESPVSSIDVTALLTRDGAKLTGQLGPAELREGRNRLLARIDANADGIVDQETWSTFSWEPNVDVSDADRCDPFDRTRCLYPFPNDYFSAEDSTTATGRRISIAPDATPQNFAGVHVDPTRWNRLDGFSVGPMLVFDVPTADLAASGAPLLTNLARSLDPDSPVALVDAATSERQLLWVERDRNGLTPDQQPLIVRVGKNLPNGRRFAAAVRDLRDAAGHAIAVPRVFRLYRDRIPTYDPAIEARRAHMEEVFAILANAGIPREELFLAWDFTTQSVESLAGALLHMRDDAFERLGDAAPGFAVTQVIEPTPEQDSRLLRDVRGTFQVPLYLTDGGLPGANLRFGPDGLPANEGDFFTATFRCTVPRSVATGGVAPVHPARPSLYGHGLLGTEGEVGAGNVRDMANEHNFVFCATRWYGMESDDFPVAISILSDFSNFPKFPDRLHHGLLSFLFLGRLMIHPDGFASHPAFQIGDVPLIDASELFYDGNSQGAIAGGALAAIAQDFTRAVLGVPGMNYSTLLDRSVDFGDFNNLFRITYPNNLDRQVLLSLAEMLWEQGEVNGHALHITSDPYPNTPPKKILLQMAFGDHQTANSSVEVEARSIGARLRTPAVGPEKVLPDADPYFGIEPIPAFPFDGSALVVWDSGNPAPPVGNVPPPQITEADAEWAQLSACARNFGSDPHECPRRQSAARLQKSEFLRPSGAVIDTCGTGPCLAPNP